MPLSKARNRDRMRQSRLHKQISPLTGSEPVQPEAVSFGAIADSTARDIIPVIQVDADGNPIYEA